MFTFIFIVCVYFEISVHEHLRMDAIDSRHCEMTSSFIAFPIRPYQR